MGDELKQKAIEKGVEMSEIQQKLLDAAKKVESSKDQAEKAKAKAKSLQGNYDSLVANKGDSKELIQERDKAKAKCDLLTDKCKKLLAKCKQQEDTIKKHSEDLDMKK